jgi:hypothetical protein
VEMFDNEEEEKEFLLKLIQEQRKDLRANFESVLDFEKAMSDQKKLISILSRRLTELGGVVPNDN